MFSLEIPLLSSSLKTLIDQQTFSFFPVLEDKPGLASGTAGRPNCGIGPSAFFLQFREIELWLMCERDIVVAEIAAAGATTRRIHRSRGPQSSSRRTVMGREPPVLSR